MSKMLKKTSLCALILVIICTMLSGCKKKHQHNYKEEVISPTCLSEGYTIHKCECGESYKDSIVNALGHDLKHIDKKEPTCTVEGYEAYDKCTRCDYTTFKGIPATDHKSSDWIIDEDATCEKEGRKHKECSVCKVVLEEEKIAKKNHVTTHIDELLPTCTTKGHNAYDKCENCSYTTYVEIPATGHTYEKTWSYDDEYHFHKPTCGDTTEVKDKELHTLNSLGICEICNNQIQVKPKYTIIYNANGGIFSNGESIIQKEIKQGSHFEQIELPTREGYVFHGWWLSSGEIDETKVLYQEIDIENAIVNENLEIFAEWVEKPKVDHQLETPKVSIEGNTLRWNQIDESTGYNLIIFRLYPTTKILEEVLTETSYRITDTLEAGYYQIQIRANGNGYNTVNSAYVTKLYGLRILDKVKSFEFDMSTSIVSWAEVEGATAYQIYIDNKFVEEITTTSFDMSNYNAGSHTIKVVPKRDNYYSEGSSYNFIKRRLLTPSFECTTIYNDEFIHIITWNKIEGATLYKVNINGIEHNATTNRYDIHQNREFIDGVTSLSITIRAFDENGNYLISEQSAEIVIKKLVKFTISSNITDNVTEVFGKLYVVSSNKVTECASTNEKIFYTFVNAKVIVKIIESAPNVYEESTINNERIITGLEYEITTDDNDYEIVVAFKESSDFDDFLWEKENDGIVIYGLKDPSKSIITIPDTVSEIKNIAGKSNFHEAKILEIFNKSILDLTSDEYSFLTENAVNIYTYIAGEPLVKETNEFYYYEKNNVPILLHYKAYKETTVLPTLINGKDYIIGSKLFSGKKLDEVKVSSNVIEIGDYAFNNFKGKITWLDTPKVKVFGVKAFAYINGMTKFIIPSSVEEIKEECFISDEYHDLVEISFSEDAKLKIIGNGAFRKVMFKTIVLPDSVTEIGSYAFSECKNLETITISKNMSLMKNAFASCKNLTNVYYNGTIDNWLRLINHSLNVTNSVYVNPMTSATTLFVMNGDNSYIQPTTVVIPNDITIIKKGLLNLTNVTTIIVGENVTEFEEEAFAGCYSLNELKLPFIGLTETSVSNSNYFLFGRLFDKTSNDSLVKVTQIDSTNLEKLIYSDFYMPKGLTTINITSLKFIPNGAFNNCLNLTTIKYSSEIIGIGTDAFTNSGITEFAVPINTKEFDFRVVKSLPNLTKLYLHSQVTKTWDQKRSWIDSSILVVPSFEVYYDGTLEQFLNIENNINYSTSLYLKDDNNEYIKPYDLSEIVIKEGVTSLNMFFGYNFTNLTTITLPKTLISLDSTNFKGCQNINTIYYNDSFEKWQDLNLNFENISHFYTLNSDDSYEELTNLVITNKGNTISSKKYLNWTFIKTVTIENGVTTIGSEAFKGCINLEIVNLPLSMDIVDYSAFAGCTSLKEINLNEGLQKINAYAFKDCTSLTKLVFPKTVTKIQEGILSGCSSLQELEITYFNNDVENCYALPFGYLFGTTEYTGGKLTSQKYKIKNGTVINEAMYKCYIPETLRKVKVLNQIVIPYGAFSNMSNLKEIELNTPISFIGQGVFEGCINLEKVIIPFINDDINDQKTKYAFALMFGTTSLEGTYAVWFESVKYYLPISLKSVVVNYPYDIPAFAFAGCKEITSIELYQTTNVIGDSAFKNCSSLASFTVPVNVESILTNTFYGCTNLKTIKFSNSCTVEEGAFTNCTNIVDIYINGGMYFKETSISDVQATNLYVEGTECNILNNGSDSITDALFTKVQNVYIKDEKGDYYIPTELTISQSSLMENQIYGLKVKKLIITEDVYDIAVGALAGVIGLESLTIPMVGLDYLYDTNPDNTEFRTYFGIIFGTVQYENSQTDYTDEIKTTPLYIPITLKEVVVTGGEYIAENAFRGISSITNVVLPSTIIEVGKNAFAGTNFTYQA